MRLWLLQLGNLCWCGCCQDLFAFSGFGWRFDELFSCKAVGLVQSSQRYQFPAIEISYVFSWKRFIPLLSTVPAAASKIVSESSEVLWVRKSDEVNFNNLCWVVACMSLITRWRSGRKKMSFFVSSGPNTPCGINELQGRYMQLATPSSNLSKNCSCLICTKSHWVYPLEQYLWLLYLLVGKLRWRSSI